MEWRRGSIDWSVIALAADSATFLSVTSRLAVAFSIRAENATALQANLAPASLDIEARALLDLKNGCESSRQTCLFEIAELKKLVLGLKADQVLSRSKNKCAICFFGSSNTDIQK